MPCYRCGARQTDPVRGPSPWKRGVHSGAQVLICPDCQQGRDWAAELDRCSACGSAMLTRLLGETQCRSCGAVVEPPAAAGRPAGTVSADLTAEVEAALDRIFGRSSVLPPG
jgi:uncharacterized protein (DUF983 family)